MVDIPLDQPVSRLQELEVKFPADEELNGLVYVAWR
jgi:hypothetical protein